MHNFTITMLHTSDTEACWVKSNFNHRQHLTHSSGWPAGCWLFAADAD